MDIVYLQYDQFDLRDIVWMYPILCGSPDKILLASTRSTISLDRHSSGTNKVVEFGELDNEGVIVVLEEWLCFEPRSEDGLQVPACLFLSDISICPSD